MTWQANEITSLNSVAFCADVLARADILRNGKSWQGSYIFRGVPDEDWGLVPSLARELRACQVDENVGLDVERRALAEFRKRAHLYEQPGDRWNENDLLEWWALMQHHGAPTRLLDWTRSFYVAAYFAVREKWDKAGAIWVVCPEMLEQRMKTCHPEAWRAAQQATQEEAYTSCSGAPVLSVVDQVPGTAQAISQKGLFTVRTRLLTDHGDAIDDAMKRYRGRALTHVKYVVPAARKPEIVQHLGTINVCADCLFPTMDGLGRSIKDVIEAGCRGKLATDALIKAAQERETGGHDT